MPAPTIGNTFGALEVGSSLAVFLFGVLTLQTYLYFTRFGKDRIQIQVLVGTVWCLELGHTISLAYEVYRTTILMYGKPEAAIRFPGFGVLMILGGLITMLVQSFFAYRLWSVLPHPWHYFGFLCVALASARGTMSVYAGVMGVIAPSLVEYQDDFQTFIGAILLIGACIDFTIAVSMGYFLVKNHHKSITRVTRIIDRVLAYTLRTGIAMSLGAISVLALFHAMSGTLVYLAIYAFIAKLYSNSLLSTLNSRGNLNNNSSKPTSVELPRPIQNRPNVLYPKPPPIHNGAVVIEMKKASEFNGDDGPNDYQRFP